MKKIFKALKKGRLFSSIWKKLIFLVCNFKYIIHNPAFGLISLHCPDYIKPDKGESKIVERIFSSYKRMKKDAANAAPCYLPSSLWQQNLEVSYSYLINGAKENNIDKFHFFLANFGTWKQYTGVESSTLIWEHMGSFLKRCYLQNKVFHNQLKYWKWFYNGRKPISALSYPTYGNQAGAYIDGVFVGCGSFFNEIYGSMLSGLICDIDHPVIADLGAGYGKLAYFILRDIKDFTFVDFDLPETLCLAAYYLTKIWPKKKALLYGEEDYSFRMHEKYDLIFMPPSEIGKIGEKSIDLFVNKNSLGEMTKEAVANYIGYITQATRRYFFHMNHEIYPNIYDNNEKGLLGYEYPVPNDKFTLLFRYPEIGHMLSRRGRDNKIDIFLYLYERKNNYVPAIMADQLNDRRLKI